RRHAEAGPVLQRHAGRHGHRLRRGQRHVLGRRAEGAPALRVPGPHLFADAVPAHALTHLVYLAGAVAVRDDERVARPVARAAAAVAVGRVDAGVADAHAHLARPGLRVGQLADA